MSDEKGALSKELDLILKDVRDRLKKASFLSRSMTEKLAPVEKIIVFVGKVVNKLEALEEENAFLKEELLKVNEDIAKQNTAIVANYKKIKKQETGSA